MNNKTKIIFGIAIIVMVLPVTGCLNSINSGNISDSSFSSDDSSDTVEESVEELDLSGIKIDEINENLSKINANTTIHDLVALFGENVEFDRTRSALYPFIYHCKLDEKWTLSTSFVPKDPSGLIFNHDENGEVIGTASDYMILSHAVITAKGGKIVLFERDSVIIDDDIYRKSFDDLTEYSYNDFMLCVDKKPSSCPKYLSTSSSKLFDIDSFNNSFPIEKISVINEKCIVIEYKLNRNNKIRHAYVVFERSVYKLPVTEYELWQSFGEVYFAYPNLMSDDVLDTLDVGNKYSVKEMPFDVDLEHTVYFGESDDGAELHSEETVLLKDGIFVIEYDVDNMQDGMITLTGKIFIPYGSANDKYPDNSLISNSYIPDLGNK